MTDCVQPWNRRSVLSVLGSAVALAAAPSIALAKPTMTVWKDPHCGCCGLWVEHLRRAGLQVTATDSSDMRAVKSRLGVPGALASCHTAEIGGFVIEGHVPASAIARLLKERPIGRGLAVPGMPIGSPGMEGGTPEKYDVILFGQGRQSVFESYIGTDRV